jgi:hypothetical protein
LERPFPPHESASGSKSFGVGELRRGAAPAHRSLVLDGNVPEIGLVEVSGGVQENPVVAGVPLEYQGGPTITLRFLLSDAGERGLDALRNSRRSLLKEEWTRGREPDEPSLEDAVFSPREILWVVRPEQRPWCLEKLEELRRRANQILFQEG